MRPVVVLKHEFVEFIPEELDEKTIYVSIRFATATHLCCCGCGNKVVTPLRPTDWSLVFDGKTVSLHPSVGNWSFPCQSHYWIRNNRASWAAQWTKGEIAAGRARGREAKGEYFAHRSRELDHLATTVPRIGDVQERVGWRWWLRMKAWWSK
jgi:hypothetical protein